MYLILRMNIFKITNYDHASGADDTCVDGSPGAIVEVANLEDLAPHLASLPLTSDWMGRVSWKINSDWQPLFDFHREPDCSEANVEERFDAFIYPILDLDLVDAVSSLPNAEDVDITPAVEYVRSQGVGDGFENWMAEEALSETETIPCKEFGGSDSEQSGMIWQDMLEPIKQRLVDRIKEAIAR